MLQAVAQAAPEVRSATPDPAQLTDGCCNNVDSCSECPSETTSEAAGRLRRTRTKRRRTTDRGPRLTVLNVEGSIVECQLEGSKQHSVTFKFDREDTVPIDIANNLTGGGYLANHHLGMFIEQVEDILQQLKENPKRLPVVSVNVEPEGSSPAPSGRGQSAAAASSSTGPSSLSPQRTDRPQIVEPKPPLPFRSSSLNDDVRRVSRFLVKTISEPLSETTVSSEPLKAQPEPLKPNAAALPPPSSAAALPPPSSAAAPLHDQTQSSVDYPAYAPLLPLTNAAEVPPSGGRAPPATAAADLHSGEVTTEKHVITRPAELLPAANVTLALNININTSGVYSTSGHNPAIGIPNSITATIAAMPTPPHSSPESTLTENSTSCTASFRVINPASSQPSTPPVDSHFKDLQQKLASLSMPLNGSQQHAAEPQLLSPSAEINNPLDTEADGYTESRSRRVLPSTIDIHDLDQELSKLHSQPLTKTKDTNSTAPAPSSVTVGTQVEHPIVESSVTQQTKPVAPISPPAAARPPRKISRFSVSVVDEPSQKPDQSLNHDPAKNHIDPNDSELKELLQRHAHEKNALLLRHQEELDAFYKRRRNQQKSAEAPSPSRGEESKPTSRTADPSTTGMTHPSNGHAHGHAQSRSASTESLPGTPTRQSKTFTEDLLRLIHDLGSKPQPKGEQQDKSAKPPTLNQLRLANPSYTPPTHHSLTQTAGMAMRLVGVPMAYPPQPLAYPGVQYQTLPPSLATQQPTVKRTTTPVPFQTNSASISPIGSPSRNSPSRLFNRDQQPSSPPF